MLCLIEMDLACAGALGQQSPGAAGWKQGGVETPRLVLAIDVQSMGVSASREASRGEGRGYLYIYCFRLFKSEGADQSMHILPFHVSFQTRTVLSLLPETSVSPSRDTATQVTPELCPLGMCSALPL